MATKTTNNKIRSLSSLESSSSSSLILQNNKNNDQQTLNGNEKKKKKKVIIIGAGFSGLAAAYNLLCKNEDKCYDYDVQIIEGRDRIGGRVWPYTIPPNDNSDQHDSGGGEEIIVDLGGQWVHESSTSNPIRQLMEELNIPFYNENEGKSKNMIKKAVKKLRRRSTTLYDSDGNQMSSSVYKSASKFHYKALDKDPYNCKSSKDLYKYTFQDLIDQAKKSQGNKKTTDVMKNENKKKNAKNNELFEQTLNYLQHRSECFEGGRYNELSLNDIYKSRGGPDKIPLGGYNTILKVLEERIGKERIHLNCNVTSIEYEPNYSNSDDGSIDQNKIRITIQRETEQATENEDDDDDNNQNFVDEKTTTSSSCEVINGDYCICTVPLGVLQKRKITFIPDLPQNRWKSIDNIGMGLLDKVLLQFDEKFWIRDDDSHHYFASTNNDIKHVKAFYDCTNEVGYTGSSSSNSNESNRGEGGILLMFHGGDAARRIYNNNNYNSDHDDDDGCRKTNNNKGLTDEEVVTECIQTLKGIFDGKEVPEKPKSYKVTRWMDDKYSYGSYSYNKVNSTMNDYEEIGKPIGNLLFAGEHTSIKQHSSVHGAWETGIKESNRLLSFVNNKRKQ